MSTITPPQSPGESPAAMFLHDVFIRRDETARIVAPRVLFFGVVAFVVCLIEYNTPAGFQVTFELTPYEVAGAVLGMLLVLRTNEGLSRWTEGRRLWGGIVNQSRNLAIIASRYGPPIPAWRESIIRWTIAYAHVCRRSLRGERTLPEVAALLGPETASTLAAAEHMPTAAAAVIAEQLSTAARNGGMEPILVAQADRCRAELIDLIGGCERISKTPLPNAYALTIRRFIFVFLLLLPFGLIPKLDSDRERPGIQEVDKSRMWQTPLVTMLVAFPLLVIDQIGEELQQPFLRSRINHLHLDQITSTIEANLLAIPASTPPPTATTGAVPPPFESRDKPGPS